MSSLRRVGKQGRASSQTRWALRSLLAPSLGYCQTAFLFSKVERGLRNGLEWPARRTVFAAGFHSDLLSTKGPRVTVCPEWRITRHSDRFPATPNSIRLVWVDVTGIDSSLDVEVKKFSTRPLGQHRVTRCRIAETVEQPRGRGFQISRLLEGSNLQSGDVTGALRGMWPRPFKI